MSFAHRKMRSQYNSGDDTRAQGPGGVRDYDPKRPGGATSGVPREGSHNFNPRPSTKRWPRGRG